MKCNRNRKRYLKENRHSVFCGTFQGTLCSYSPVTDLRVYNLVNTEYEKKSPSIQSLVIGTWAGRQTDGVPKSYFICVEGGSENVLNLPKYRFTPFPPSQYILM